MFSLGVLDVGIGLIFLYLILSLLCTAISELITGWSNGRGEKLLVGIRQLLHNGRDAKLAEEFYTHPLIRALTQGTRRPSYIPARTFALVVLDLLAPSRPGRSRTAQEIQSAIADLPSSSFVRRSLQVLWQEANKDLGKFHAGIESWFEATMERVGGWYKRHMQWIVLAIAAVVSVGTNADTISVTRALSTDAALRQIVVAEATAVATRSQARVSEQDAAPAPASAARADSDGVANIERYVTELRGLGLPLGWTTLPKGRDIPLKVLGLLLTTFALTLGAPFWFDMLSKVISIRGAGVRPGEKLKQQRKKTPDAAGSVE